MVNVIALGLRYSTGNTNHGLEGTDRKTMMGFRKQLSLAATRMWSKKPNLKYGYEIQDPGKLWTGLFEDVSSIQSWINVYESKTGLQVPRFATKVFSRLGRSMETKVGGLCHVPEGFQLIVIPAGTPLRLLQEKPSDMSESEWREMASERELPCSYSVPKLLISLVQALYAISTLYQARGNQIEIYGYAAFGLTVAPYAIMSAINVATNVVTPDYPCMYLVAGPDLREAERCGGVFDNIVAEINLGQRVFPVPTFMNKYTHVVASCGRWGNVWVGIVLATLIGLPLAVVGGLSRFRANASTPAQKGWTMAWLATSMAMSFFVGRVSTYGPEVATRLLFYSLFYAPAIGGMVVVGLQLRDYGICSSLDNVSIA